MTIPYESGGARAPAALAMKHLLTLALCFAAALDVRAAEPAYNEAGDAKAEIRQALGQAQASGNSLPVLVVFGANWCGDCKVLDLAMKQGSAAPLMAREFKVVKVDVGRFDRNLDLALAYGVPLKKGIPAVAVLSAKNEVIYVTQAGELADARNMGEAGIHDFFKGVSARAK